MPRHTACSTGVARTGALLIGNSAAGHGAIGRRGADHAGRAQLLRRPGTALDVAEAALYLASPMSAFLTGETLPVNGGGFVIGHNQVWERYLEKV